MMNLQLKLLAQRNLVNKTSTRTAYYKFERYFTPPIKEKKESPYIVGPYLKPDYLETKYITDEIKHRHDNDLDHFIYKPIKVETDEDRRVNLLLIEDVEGLGVAGAVIAAPFRFGASKLVAMKKAEYLTDFSQKWYKFGPRSAQSASTALSPRTARFLTRDIFDLPIAQGVDVKPWHISLALRLSGCVCPVEAIEESSISEILQDGSPLVKCIVRINNHERIEVKFKYAPMARESLSNLP